MIFKNLTIQNFKKFASRTIDFMPGINVIKGNNEQGKSSILKAIEAVLYYNPSTKSQKLLESIKSWNSENKPLLELYFAQSNHNYLLKRNFEAGESSLTQEESKKSVNSEDIIDKQIVQFTGITNLDIFTSTALVKHSQVADLKGSDGLIEALQKVLVGSNDKNFSVNQILNRIKQKVSSYRLGLDRPSSKPGIIKNLKDKLENREKEYARITQIYERVVKSKKMQIGNEEKLNEIKKKITILETLIGNKKILDESKLKLEKLNKDISEIEEKMIALHDDKRESEELYIKFEAVALFDEIDLDEHVKKIINTKSLLNSLEKEIVFLSSHTNKLPQEKNNSKVILFTAFALSFVAIAGLVLALISQDIFVSIVSALILIVSLALFYWDRRRDNDTNSKTQSNQANLIADKKEELKRNESEFEGLLNEVGCKSEEEFFQKKQYYNILKNKIKELDAKIQGRLAGKDMDYLRKYQASLMAEKREIETTYLTDDVRISNISSQELIRKKLELEEMKREEKQLERESMASTLRVEEADVSSEDVVKLEEEIAFIKDNLARAEKTVQSYIWLYKGINETILKISENIGDVVEAEVERYLPILTSNKYHKAKFENDLSIKVFSQEKNEWVSPIDNLSTGTIDQIYFLVRLAILNIMSPNDGIPIFFDDTFVTFDKLRLENTFKILKDVAETRQIIIFTCHDYFDKWGNLQLI